MEIKKTPNGDIAKWKSRLVVLGHSGNVKKYEHFYDTFSAAPNICTTRLLRVMVAQLGYVRGNCDLETAFLHGRLPRDERLVVQVPGEKGVRILEGNLYGLPQADRVYTKARDSYILDKFNNLPGWSCRKALYDPCLFIFNREVNGKTRRLYCVIHTDDVDCVAEDQRDMDVGSDPGGQCL